MLERLLLIGFSNAVLATLLALLAFGISRFVRTTTLIHALWLLVFLKLLTPPCWSIPVPFPTGTNTTDAVIVGKADPTADISDSVLLTERRPTNLSNVGDPDAGALTTRKGIVDGTNSAEIDGPRPTIIEYDTRRTWVLSLGFAWILGAIAWFGLLVHRIRRFGSLISRADEAPAEILREVESFSARIGLRLVPKVRVTHAAIPPFIWAVASRPVIVLPNKLLAGMTEDERATLLAHELSHLYRRDHWVMRLETIVSGLYWWHPVVWFARRRLHEAAESCCDDCVLSWLPDSAAAYARALVRSIEFIAESPSKAPVVAIPFAQLHFVKRRIQMILREETKYRMSAKTKFSIVFLSAVVLPLSVYAVSADTTKQEQSQSYSSSPTPDSATTVDSDNVDERMNRLEELLDSLSQQVGQLLEERTETVEKPPRDANNSHKPIEADDRDDVLLELTRNPEDKLFRQLNVIEAQLTLCRSNHNRTKAARKQLTALEEAYEDGTVSLDLLLDAQRRLNSSQKGFAQSVFGLDESPSVKSRAHFLALQLKYDKDARDRALSTWRKIHVLYESGAPGGEAENEAQAREQYFYFRKRVDETLTKLRDSLTDSKQSIVLPADQSDFTIRVGQSRIIASTTGIARALVNSPTVARIVPLSPTKVQISGKSSGETSVNLWDAVGNVNSYDVTVSP